MRSRCESPRCFRAYHRYLTRTINARYREAIKLWEGRIVECVGRRDEQTVELAKHLDKLQRRGVDAVCVLDLAARRKPLPVDRANRGTRLPGQGADRSQAPAAPVGRPVRAATAAAFGPGIGPLGQRR